MMSEPPSSAADTQNSRLRQPSRLTFAPDLEELDHRLKHLSDHVLPLRPLLLTLPTNAPFHLGNRFVDNWAVGRDGPFSPKEHQLQYMTFLTHHDGDSLLVAVGDWSDETGRMMSDQTAPYTAGNPREGGARKKISLKDYKNQRNSGVAVSPANHGAGSANALEGQRAPKSDGAKNSDRPSTAHSGPLPEKGPQKRPSESDREHAKPQGMKHPDQSTKKPRLSPAKDTLRAPTPSQSHSPRLPALLSPTLPPTSSPKLPRLLSPTLPPDIEKELASLGERTPVPNLSPKRDIAGKPKREDVAYSKVPNATGSGSNTGLHSRHAGVSDHIVAPSLHPKDAHAREHLKDNRPLDSKVQFRCSAKPQLVVKLRYGKSNRKRVEALLKFSGKRKSHLSDSPLEQDLGCDGGAQDKKKRDDLGACRGNPLSGRARNKINHETDEAPAAPDGRVKERKDSNEKPRTPVSHPSLGFSLVATHDKSKSTSLTPVKETRSSISNRNDFVDAPKLSPSQSDSRSRFNESRAWRDEYQKFAGIGRELKHAAERYTSKSDATTAEEKLGAVTAMEAILCFILTFVADDQSKALARQVADSSNWLSILAYWRVVKKISAPYSPLKNLCLLLGAVSYDAIHALDLERLAVSPLPGENTPVPTPGSDGNTVLSDESKKSRKEFLELKTRLLECYKESQKLWLEGTRGLPEDILAREFPATWSQRSRNYSERGRQPLKVGEYAGAYFVPLGGTAAPIEVVRFGWALLKEWCAKEGVDWHGRLGL